MDGTIRPRETREKMNVAFIGNYIPRQCGLATFTTDLASWVAETLGPGFGRVRGSYERPAGGLRLPADGALRGAREQPARIPQGSRDFSTKVECLDGQPIVADRTMSWTGPGAASPETHSSVVVTAPAQTWYLAECPRVTQGSHRSSGTRPTPWLSKAWTW